MSVDRKIRRFELHRDSDITGVSGTGVVAEGVAFSDGTVALRWTSDWPTSVVFHDRGVEAVQKIHGHGGATRIVWLDAAKDGRLARIAEAHHKHVDAHGGTYGVCAECEMAWPCPTYVWATKDRNAAIDCWDPRDDQDDQPPLLSVEGKDTSHDH